MIDTNYELLDEIKEMEKLFEKIKLIFKLKNPKENYADYAEELTFMMDKLSIIIEVSKNKEVKNRSKELYINIKKYKEKENLKDYNIKNNVLLELVDLTSSNRNVGRGDILLGIKNIRSILKVRRDDFKDIRDKDLIFVSKLAMGIKEEANISEYKRLLTAKKLLMNLLDYVIASYEKSNLPFDFYEKIMIINILDEVYLTL